MSPSTQVIVPKDSQIEAKWEVVNEQALEASPINIFTNETRVMSHCGLLGTYTGDFVNGKRHGRGVFKYNRFYDHQTAKVYSGGWVDDVLDGDGILTDFHGNTFTGTFRNNALQGFARKRINNMEGDHVLHFLINRFDGEFNDQNYNIKSGVGTFVNGWTFHCGYDKNGKPHGKGCVKNCVGKVLFESEWKNGKCDRKLFDYSSFVLKFGAILSYVGIFFVVMFMIIVVGHWSFDFKYQVVNQSIDSYPLTGTYTGQIWHYNRHGLGVAVLDGQGVYNGSWENGLRHGHGVMKWEDPERTKRGDVFVGEWRKGQMAHGAYSFYDGKVYTGDFVASKMHGYGVLNYTDGSSYAGQFNKNWREGNGTLIERYGSKVCKGQWLNDKQSVVFSCVDNSTLEGAFLGLFATIYCCCRSNTASLNCANIAGRNKHELICSGIE